MTKDKRVLVLMVVGKVRSAARRLLSPGRRHVLSCVAVLALLWMGAPALAPATAVHAAAPYTVSGTSDEDDVNACNDPTVVAGAGGDGQLSLREAICEANNAGGAQTIDVPAGTYNLVNVDTMELQVGSASGADITIVGAGAASTIIHQTVAGQRVFDLDFNGSGNVAVTISNVTISGGTGTAFGGGGILAGGTGDNTTLDHVLITGNTTSGGNQGGGIGYGGGGNLTITNSAIVSNTSDLLGGGIAFNQTSNAGNLTIATSVISGNTVANASGGVNGGGLAVTGNNTVAITGSTFTNNSLSGGSAVNQHGGGIEVEGGTLNLSFSRIVGNTAGNGRGLYVGGGATANATNNWWGCNGGPGAAGCDDAAGAGTIHTAPFLTLTLTADATHIDPNSSTGLTATTTINSAGVDTSGLGHIPDSPPTPDVTFGGTLGSVSPSSVGLTAGRASATYTAGGTGGVGSASATLDNATATINITITTPTATPTDTATSTSTSTSTATPTGTSTDTPTSTPTDTPTGTATDTSTATPTGTSTDTSTATPSSTPTTPLIATATSTPTASATATTTGTPTSTPSTTSSATATGTPTQSPTDTYTPAAAPTRTSTATSTATVQPSPVLTPRFYFAGGVNTSAQPAFINLLNPGPVPAHVRLAFYSAVGTAYSASLTVAPTTARTVPVSDLAPIDGAFGLVVAADRTIAAQITLTRRGKDDDMLAGAIQPQRRWFLAEGYTDLTFHEVVTIFNPDPERTALVTLRLLPQGSRQDARTVTVSVPAHAEASVDVNRVMPRQAVSIVVTAAQPVVIERTMTFGRGGYGLTARLGASATAQTWYFAEGTTTRPFQTFITVMNPGMRSTGVTLRFYGHGGVLLAQHSLLVGGQRRATLRLQSVLHATEIATIVTSSQPVVVERPEYFGSPNAPGVPGAVGFGVLAPEPRWGFAGGEMRGMSDYLLLFNPTGRAGLLRVTVDASDGRTRSTVVLLRPHVRFTLEVGKAFPGLTSVRGATVSALNGQGFVAEETVFARDYTTLRSTTGVAR